MQPWPLSIRMLMCWTLLAIVTACGSPTTEEEIPLSGDEESEGVAAPSGGDNEPTPTPDDTPDAGSPLGESPVPPAAPIVPDGPATSEPTPVAEGPASTPDPFLPSEPPAVAEKPPSQAPCQESATSDDTVSPQVASVQLVLANQPGPIGMLIPTDPKFLLQFSEPMHTQSLTSVNFPLTCGDQVIPNTQVTASSDGKAVLFSAGGLPEGTPCALTVTTAVCDGVGNPLPEPYVLSGFSTCTLSESFDSPLSLEVCWAPGAKNANHLILWTVSPVAYVVQGAFAFPATPVGFTKFISGDYKLLLAITELQNLLTTLDPPAGDGVFLGMEFPSGDYAYCGPARDGPTLRLAFVTKQGAVKSKYMGIPLSETVSVQSPLYIQMAKVGDNVVCTASSGSLDPKSFVGTLVLLTTSQTYTTGIRFAHTTPDTGMLVEFQSLTYTPTTQ